MPSGGVVSCTTINSILYYIPVLLLVFKISLLLHQVLLLYCPCLFLRVQERSYGP